MKISTFSEIPGLWTMRLYGGRGPGLHLYYGRRICTADEELVLRMLNLYHDRPLRMANAAFVLRMVHLQCGWHTRLAGEASVCRALGHSRPRSLEASPSKAHCRSRGLSRAGWLAADRAVASRIVRLCHGWWICTTDRRFVPCLCYKSFICGIGRAVVLEKIVTSAAKVRPITDCDTTGPKKCTIWR